MVHMHGMYLGTTILFRCLKRGRADAITTNFLGMVVEWSWNGRGHEWAVSDVSGIKDKSHAIPKRFHGSLSDSVQFATILTS